MHTFFVLILYKGADQTALMHGLSLSLSLSLYLHWQTVWTQIGPEYNSGKNVSSIVNLACDRKLESVNTVECPTPMQTIIHTRIDGLVSRCLRNQAKNTNFVRNYLSLSLSFYDLFSKFANSLDPEDR